jgi:hypothetical protein
MLEFIHLLQHPACNHSAPIHTLTLPIDIHLLVILQGFLGKDKLFELLGSSE